MEIIIKICILITFCLLGIFLSGCFNTKPKPKPEPEPDKPKWSDYYPDNYTIPVIDLEKRKWQQSNYNSDKYNRYIVRINWWNENIAKLPMVQKGEINDRKLFAILHLKNLDGSYKFQWTSDMERWGKEDHWASPENFLTLVDENCNIIEPEIFEPNPEGFYRDDCDGFSRYHNHYIMEWCKYYLSFFLEVYWKRKYFNTISNKYEWKKLGHAITVFKKTPESNWGCFSNQQWLSASKELPSFMDFVYKFVPINKPEFEDQYKLIKIRARHPIDGTLLWEINENDINQIKEARKVI